MALNQIDIVSSCSTFPRGRKLGCDLFYLQVETRGWKMLQQDALVCMQLSLKESSDMVICCIRLSTGIQTVVVTFGDQ